VEFWDSKRV